MELLAKLNPSITQGARKAGMYVCKAGHMAIHKSRQGKKGVVENQADTYYFDVEQCRGLLSMGIQGQWPYPR